MIEGAAVLLAGIALGWWGRRMADRSSRGVSQAAVTPRPLCSCGDPPSLHDPQTGQCHAEHLTMVSDTGMKHMLPCKCRRYDGPEPLPEFYAPEIKP